MSEDLEHDGADEPVVDEFAALHEYDLLKLFEELSFRAKWTRVFAGLRQPRESGQNKWARLQVTRLLAPVMAVIVPFLMLGLITLFAQFNPVPVTTVQVRVIDPEPVENLEQIDEPDFMPPEPPDPIDIRVDFTVDVQSMPTESAAPPAEAASVAPAAFDSVAMVRSPVIMRGMLGSRAPGARGTAINRYGGKWGAQSEAALIKALEWLKDNQHEDGYWRGRGSADSRAAMTGLALLTFLAHGETPASPRYGLTVQKAIQYLISLQQVDGSFRHTEGGVRGGVYAHGIATYALCEAFALTRIPMIKPAMEKAVAHIIKGQRPDGGFDYKFAHANGERDRCTSVAGWQAQAMKAASLTNVNIPGLNEALVKAAAGFKLQYPAGSGHFIYASNSGGTRGSMTPIGTLCLQLLGHSRSREVRGGLTAILDWAPSWDKPDMSNGILEPVYVWYYATQVYFHEGGRIWERWNDLFAPMLINSQNADGSWTFSHGRSSEYGPVYHTTLSALMLTVYYRYLPTFQEIPKDEIDRELGDDQDLHIEII